MIIEIQVQLNAQGLLKMHADLHTIILAISAQQGKFGMKDLALTLGFPFCQTDIVVLTGTQSMNRTNIQRPPQKVSSQGHPGVPDPSTSTLPMTPNLWKLQPRRVSLHVSRTLLVCLDLQPHTAQIFWPTDFSTEHAHSTTCADTEIETKCDSMKIRHSEGDTSLSRSHLLDLPKLFCSAFCQWRESLIQLKWWKVFWEHLNGVKNELAKVKLRKSQLCLQVQRKLLFHLTPVSKGRFTMSHIFSLQI
ncbi:uncharacterized protein LOC122543148 [Chiloscyllium plagiosum]|uniref:uncharacterized protein LOC122543148 n=1 Tax=Chiloscyllium plagiosum TaxID=36176 RepID=UPI001CB86113|nr:uncharacterized protein LOC122543148 [Chiloscyllium plagiosum]